MPCPRADEIQSFVEGTLVGAARDDLAGHLRGCRACAEVVGELERWNDPAPVEDGPPPILPAGSTVDRYVVRELVGSGAMGRVYRTFDARLERDVALKLLRADGPQGSLARRLVREAQVLARLSHPNVVAIHDAGTHEGQVYLAVDLGRETFGAWLRARTRRDVGEVLRLLLHAGEGLAAAHASGFVHRDVKPENVLIGMDGRALITDFGLALAAEGPRPVPGDAPMDGPTVAAGGVLVGTPAYMAPEQLAGKVCDERSDQFAFSVMMFEALSGQRPFRARSVTELRAVIAARRIDAAAARRMPRWLRPIVRRGLSVDPADRWPSMRAFLDAVRRGPPLTRTGTIVGATACAALLLVVAALAWGVASTSRQRQRAERRLADVRHLATSFLFDFHSAIETLPGTTKARELVVERASQYLDILASESSGDVGLERDLATAFEKLARIQEQDMRQTAAARQSYERALAIRAALAAAAPDDDALTADLAKTLDRVGMIHGEDDEGLAQIVRALHLRTRLAARAKGDPSALIPLATSYQSLGAAIRHRGGYATAVLAYGTGRALDALALARRPDDLTAARNLALADKYMGGVLEELGHNDDAAGALYAEAIRLDGARVAAAPLDAEAKLDLSYSYGALAHERMTVKDLTGALELYQKALALREEIARQDPASTTAQTTVAKAHFTIASVQRAAGDPRRALQSATTAHTILTEVLAVAPDVSDELMTRIEIEQGLDEDALAKDPALLDAERAEHLRAACADYRRAAERERLRGEKGRSASRRKQLADLSARIASCDPAVARQ